MESSLKRGLSLYWIFCKGMMFAFTNGMAALPSIERSIVDRRKWLTNEEFWTYPVLGQSLPGVISLHNAVLIGNRISGPFGAAMAALGVLTPAFVCMLAIAALFRTFVDDPYVQGAIRGIRVISVVIIFSNAVRLLRTVQKNLFSVVLAAAALMIPLLGRGSAFRTIIACGAAGIISVLIDPAAADSGNAERKSGS